MGWVDAVLSDPDYQLVKKMRDPLTYSCWKNRVMWESTTAGARTGFVSPFGTLTPTVIIDRAIAVGERHVDTFLAGVVAGTLP
jgi:hypothetical protein